VQTNFNKQEYLVSAIISIYNCERFISGCLENLEKQTISNRIEIIAVNSGSQQNEKKIIHEYQNKYNNIKYIETKERESIYKAWNRGIKVASGKYITNANSDDRYRKDALEIMTTKLDENINISLVYINQIVTETENQSFDRHTPIHYYKLRSTISVEDLLFSKPPHCGSQTMWRKNLHDIYGYFNENMEIAGDFEFWLRIADKCALINIDEYLGLYFYSPNSAANKDWAKVKEEEVKIRSDYLSFIKGHKRIFNKMKIKLSLDCADLGNYLLMHGSSASARHYFIKGVRFSPFVIDNYRLLIASYLPYSTHLFLRRFKGALFG